MSDITPADALRELGDDQAEYAAAAAKKLGLPESVEYVEMRTEYGVRWVAADEFEQCDNRAEAEKIQRFYDGTAVGNYGEVHVVAREVITTAWREVTA